MKRLSVFLLSMNSVVWVPALLGNYWSGSHDKFWTFSSQAITPTTICRLDLPPSSGGMGRGRTYSGVLKSGVASI
jgi:hypothetical protein